MNRQSRVFYEEAFINDDYAASQIPESHSSYSSLLDFIQTYDLKDKVCLEVGTGRGAFKNIVNNYVGMDIAYSASRFLFGHNFLTATATELPFETECFDGIWTIAVLEHVQDPEKAFNEIWRVLRPGGFLFLAPAWNCRPWAADGYPVRPYSDFKMKGKLLKASIPIRDNLIYRAVLNLPLRLISLLKILFRQRCTRLKYKELKPNFEHFWMPDSDAVNAIDPFEAYAW